MTEIIREIGPDLRRGRRAVRPARREGGGRREAGPAMSQPAGRPLFDVLTEDLYAQVLRERPAAEAAAWLADECRKKDRANEALREHVRALLRALDQGGQALDQAFDAIEAAREALG